MRLRKYNTIPGMVSLAAASFLLSGCDMALLNPKGEIGLEQRTLILTAIGLMLLVVIPAIVMAILFAWRYKESNQRGKYDPNFIHSGKVEAVVWGIPIIIIAILGTITWKTTHSLDPYRPIHTDQKPLTIEVVALDWKWLFIYPEQGIATVNEIAFPSHRPVEFKVTSNTVMNSFFIPRLGSQIYAMAGMQTKLHLIANEPGTYQGISANYSGQGFSGMKFAAITTADEQGFENWVAKVKQSPQTLDSVAAFERLATPSENVKPQYYASVKPGLFNDIIGKFMHSGMHAHHQPQKAMTQHPNGDVAMGTEE